MREIDHNKINGLNFKGIQKVPENAPQPETQNTQTESKEIKDLANMPAASLGKSQVGSDSIEADLKFLSKNPQIVAGLNKAIDEYASNHSEEETLMMIEKMHQEFVSKK